MKSNAVAFKEAAFSYYIGLDNSNDGLETVWGYGAPGMADCSLTESYGYDHDGDTTSLTDEALGTSRGDIVENVGATYNANQQLTGVTNSIYSAEDQTNAYDHDGQLTSSGASYAYDDNGNISGSGDMVGDGNAQLSANGYTYTYDAAGNTITETNTSTGDETDYTWDNRDRLTSVTSKNSSGVIQQVVTYTYDAFNQLIGESVTPYSGGVAGTTATQRFVYDMQTGQMDLAFDGSGNLTDRFLWGPLVDQILADEKVTSLSSAGSIEWMATNNTGSVSDVFEYGSTPTLLDHVVYDAFGGIASQTDSTYQPLFTYNGEYTDPATGLQKHGDRWYDPRSQRWLTQDPIFPLSGSNPYEYCNNSPTNGIDPSGLFDFLGKSYVFPWQEGASLNPFNSIVALPARQLAGEADSLLTTGSTVPLENANDVADAGLGSLGSSVASIPKGAQSAYYTATRNDVEARRTGCDAYKMGPLGQTENAPGLIKYGTRGALGVATAATVIASSVGAAEYFFLENESILVEGLAGGNPLGKGGLFQLRPNGGAPWFRFDLHPWGGGPTLPHVDAPPLGWHHWPWWW
jgi:RHS repeat-associated protein